MFYIKIKQIAVDKPNLVINNKNKRIDNPREAFLFENEKRILGKKGFTFKYYPTKKEKLKFYLKKDDENDKNNKIQSNSFNFISNNNANATFYSHKNFSNDNPTKRLNKNNEILNPQKNKTQMNFFKKSPSALNLNKNTNNPYSFNSISNLFEKNISKLDKIKSALNNINYKPNYKYFSPISKNVNNKINEKIKYETLKIKPKKNKLNVITKTHFKGLESLLIKPKEIYDLFKMEDLLKIKRLGNDHDMNVKHKKYDTKVEKNNEYKLDIKELIDEEQEIQNLTNTREFSNLLGNNKFFKEVEYKKDKLKVLKNETKDEYMPDNTQEKKQKMNYLKKLAFNQNLNEKSQFDDESYSDDNSVNYEGKGKNKRRQKLKNMETELKIDGKVYQMKNQIDKICKELLIKYKVYENIKK